MENTPKLNTMQDEATKRTASDALFSKIYSAKLGYFKDDYSNLFTRKTRKMMPIINRGTWTRVYSVRTLINNFIEKFKDLGQVQILSLGAGLDSNFFHYQENSQTFRDANVKYIEVDFPEITVEKIEVIKDNETLQKLIFGDSPSTYNSDSISAPKYNLFPCDIRDTDLLESKLTAIGVDQT
jgi:O-methyltransferase involved in polyketide biosynthesis